MSGQDEQDDKGFLARWSQRKLEAKQPEEKLPEPKPDLPAAETAEPKPQDQTGEAVEEFDLSTLPKLEDITGTTDVSVFLRKGVPEHLRNAALRKSWALDPAVRNYVNPALDYAYDWNTPGGVPGTGELGAGIDISKLVAQIMGDEPPAEGKEATAIPSVPPSEHAAVQGKDVAFPTHALRVSDEAVSGAEDGTTEASKGRESDTPDSVAPQRPVRRHGSAKPTD
ncbi:DUF3306 domain-containing protein [Bradyrhizobium lablabi]|uniref:DUF3306 domain-containing protein n=1 Tax=Bradyrhizobium lablabi TaxID=722472 RepID=UPI001BAD6A66|nr:DUF3306 domain-containing protein [Bradyrhizobium lablabi]MBR1121116.1 DUF3306 domain-containing protein [Bradyrhizobium lablabi]